jgi:site-specific recombinase XerD
MNKQLVIIDSQPPRGNEQALSPLNLAIEAWIHNKFQHSGSLRTERAYRTTLEAFRRQVESKGLDLDSATNLSTYLQVWASQGTPRSKADRTISRATFNHRLAVVSSFYRFALRRGYLSVPNPAEGIERGEVQAYAKAQPLNPGYVKGQLRSIDLTTLAGQRDFALLQVALVTGRRRAELEGLRYGDLRQEGEHTVITWRRAKGGKVMFDALPKAVSAALMRYLHAAYGAQLGTLAADAAVWIALDPVHRGHALTAQAIADICLAHLGTSKVHTTRHTFAHQMEATGAKVSEIQARLGHASMETTGGYLAALKSAYNPHAEELAALFGAE